MIITESEEKWRSYHQHIGERAEPSQAEAVLGPGGAAANKRGTALALGSLGSGGERGLTSR